METPWKVGGRVEFLWPSGLGFHSWQPGTITAVDDVIVNVHKDGKPFNYFILAGPDTGGKTLDERLRRIE